MIPIKLKFDDVMHIIHILHGERGSRRLTVEDNKKKKGYDDYDRRFDKKQLEMAEQEDDIIAQLMNAHVANGGSLEDFARL